MGIPYSQLPERIKNLLEGDPPPSQSQAGAQPGAKAERASRSLERSEQRIFANWCLLKGLPYVWHSTHKRSRATPGTPDFIVGAKGKVYWLEFKLPGGKLSVDQQQFGAKLAAAGLVLYRVDSAAEAIRILDQ